MLHTSYDDRCHRTELGEAFSDFTGNGSLDLSSLGFVLLIHDDHSVVIEGDPHTVGPAHLLLRADDHRTHQLAAHVGGAFLDAHRGEVPQPQLGLTAPDTMVAEDRDDLHGPGTGVIGACEPRPRRKGSRRLGLLCLHGFCTSTTTKVVLFESGLHSAIFTMSPTLAWMQGGLWAWSFELRFSYRLYLRT